ncbi:MAG: acyltransferase [Desulfosarcina sp.]|nr:acyltransferase [Desulfosarcina sp.]
MNPDTYNSELSSITYKFDKVAFLFKWLPLFYPKAKGIHFIYLAYVFIPQKVLRINGRVPWPVHFTSRVLYYKNITVGNRTAPGLNANCYIQGRNGIDIGHNVRIGPGVGLISANHDVDDYDRWPHCSPMIIGNNVWIGMNTVVLPGITIGDNVAVGANSVVTKKIPSNSRAAGNPCRVIREKAPYKGKDYSRLSR